MRVHFTNQFEVGVIGVPVSVDSIGHYRFTRTYRDELLDHNKMWLVCVRALLF